ncbi:MAG: hypothetical protein KatS3mg114_1169 [Planctomycetaceae bacterium]|nr:MAG: hypothetical protein KatS3mg114_1169 [Planctomycetaceae bacterium]
MKLAASSADGKQRCAIPRWRMGIFPAVLLLLGLSGIMALSAGPYCQARMLAAYRARHYEAAEQWLERWQSWVRSPEIAYWRARLHRKLFRADLALEWLNKAEGQGLDADRLRREYLLLQAEVGRLEGIFSQLQEWLLHPDDDGAELCEAFARGLIIREQISQAEQVIRAWRLEYPRDPQAYLVWGRYLESERRIQQAEREYQSALDIDPRYAPAWYARARVARNRGDYELAAKHYEQAAAVLQARAAADIGKAHCLYELGQAEQALHLLRQVIELPADRIERSFALVQDPDPTLPAQRLLARIEVALGYYAEALPWLEQALAREPRDQSLRYLRVQCWQALGKNELAQQELAELAQGKTALAEADRLVDEIKQQPHEPQVDKRYRVGEIYWLHDSSRKAEYWLRSVLAYDPTHRQAHRLLADYHSLRAQYEPWAADTAAYHRRMAGIDETAHSPSTTAP